MGRAATSPSPWDEERLAIFAVAEAHLLSVEGAPLEGGGRAPQLEPILQRARS
jgi:hypothetical protein